MSVACCRLQVVSKDPIAMMNLMRLQKPILLSFLRTIQNQISYCYLYGRLRSLIELLLICRLSLSGNLKAVSLNLLRWRDLGTLRVSHALLLFFAPLAMLIQLCQSLFFALILLKLAFVSSIVFSGESRLQESRLWPSFVLRVLVHPWVRAVHISFIVPTTWSFARTPLLRCFSIILQVFLWLWWIILLSDTLSRGIALPRWHLPLKELGHIDIAVLFLGLRVQLRDFWAEWVQCISRLLNLSNLVDFICLVVSAAIDLCFGIKTNIIKRHLRKLLQIDCSLVHNLGCRALLTLGHSFWQVDGLDHSRNLLLLLTRVQNPLLSGSFFLLDLSQSTLNT